MDVRKMVEENRISIIGPGRMGTGIATAFLASHGAFEIRLVDLKKRSRGNEFHLLHSAKEEIASNLNLLKDLGELKASPHQLLSGLSLHRDLEEGVRKAAYVFEALPEKPVLKQSLIIRLEPLLDKSTVIASATSTINLDTFWQVAVNPERIIIAHWLNPAFIIPLVEVSVGEKTSKDAAEKLKALLTRTGKIPVTIKDSPGFIVPRIQVAAMNEAVRILEEGVATPEDIDTAIKAGFGFRLAVLGLIEFIDLGGMDILYHASHFLFSKLGESHYKPVTSIVEKMEKGEIGPRSGKGFFDYSKVNIDAMFKNRYKGFVELLNLVTRSEVLNFRGGIRDE
jgi:3-hydroxybutyryl-CoA dehydrogenase